jgi:RHS repeat-associated protein
MRGSFLFSAVLWLGVSSALYGQANPGTFTFTGSMSVQREQASATLITGCNCPADGKVLVAGGVIDGATFTTNTAELYDPATGKFTSTGTMNVARSGQAAALLPGGKVLIVGAFNSPGPLDAEIYDPVTGTFSCVAGTDPTTGFCNATLVHNSGVLTATALQSGNVLVTGLQTPTSGGQASNAAAIYDPLQTSFTCINGMSSTPLICNQSTTSQHTSGTATLLANGTVLIAGGADPFSGPTSSAEIYDPTIAPSGTFVTTGSLLTTRANHAAVLLKTGEVLIAGGGNGSGNFNTAEVYANGQFTPVGNMAHVRLYPTATLLNDGTGLIAGGCCEVSNSQMPYAEIYNPTTKTFSPTGDMNDARALHTATLLPTGQVLVAGGFFDLTAELYTPGLPPPPPPSVPPSNIGGGNVASSSSPTSAQDNLRQSGTFSDPISTGNGNYFYQHTDFMIPGRGMPLVFQRSYNSLDNYVGPLGTNWTHAYNIFLIGTATGIVIKWGDGHGESFTLSGGGYVPQPGVFNTLAKNTDGTFVLSRKDQTQFTFSAGGALTSIRDKNGNTVSMTYAGGGNLVQITDTVGRNVTLSYDASNRITQIGDPIGRTATFQYDANNNLAQATDTAGGVTMFAYDASHRVTSITQPNGQTLLANTYDLSGRVISHAGGRGFSTTLAYGTPNPTDTTITDARGNQMIHTYDSSLRIVKITQATGGMTSFAYDTNNDRTSVTNQNGKTTNFSYDSTGNVTGITDPLGNAIAFTYDTKGDLLTATNAKGKTTTFTYGVTGNLTAIKDALTNTTAFGYDGFGELSSKTDARGNSTGYLYDSLGNLTRITDALSHRTTLAYDGIGRLTSITDPNGHVATATYDALSRLVTITDPLANQTKFAYDAVGNLQKITDANGHVTSYAYDATNNLVTVTDALGHVTQYAYDANNNRIAFTNAKGNATSYAYDGLNRLSRITDPLSFSTAYAYDSVGNVLAVTDAKGQTNQFTYDALNRLLSIAYADGKSVAYAYDANGNRVSMADSHGTTTYAYDVLDRLTSVTNPGGKVVTYAYDAVGNMKSLTYPDGKVVSYSFDPANRISAATDWLGRNTAYSYDAAANLIRTSYPNGTNIAFGYDAANRLAQVVNALKGLPALTLAYTLDAVGNRAALSVDGLKTNFSYDALNELLSAQLGPLKSTWTYDAVGNRLKQISPLGTIAYTYDAGDRLLAAGTATFTYDANGNQTSVAQTFSSQPLSYQYDSANRLVAVTGGRPTSSFAYDGDGNRISQSVGTGIYNYLNDVATALPVVLQESGPDGNISYAYGLGLISESSPKFDYFYHYDGLGSVIALSNASGKPSAAYVYDPWGNPLLSVSDSVGTKNKFRFTGEALDPGTQLYYLRARYYDPSIARFFIRDRAPAVARAPLSLNRYQYVLSNPVRLRDPSGLTAQDMSGTSPWAPLALDFSLPNTVLNPQFTPPSGGSLSPPCNGGLDCLDFVLSGIGTVVSGPLKGQALAFGALGVETLKGDTGPTLVIDIATAGLAFCPTLYCKAAGGAVFLIQTILKIDAQLPPNGTTPSIATPISPIQIK